MLTLAVPTLVLSKDCSILTLPDMGIKVLQVLGLQVLAANRVAPGSLYQTLTECSGHNRSSVQFSCLSSARQVPKPPSSALEC